MNSAKNVREHCAGIQLGLQADAGSSSEADAIGEQQPKRTRSGAAAEADASGEHAAAAEAGTIGEQQLEADANGEQQLKRLQSGQGAAAEADAIGGQADAIGEQQLCTESCPAPDYSQ